VRLTTNMAAMNAWRHLSHTNQSLSSNIGHLSSGQRITSAKDDVAGLGISERMRTHIWGMRQTMRNVQDGISFVQTSEAALQEVNSILQRGRELTLQAANGTLTDNDKGAIQIEMQNILSEVDRISESAEFNHIKLLGGAIPNGTLGTPQEAAMMDALRRSWLSNAETVIEAQYGLTGDDATLKIVADTAGSALAYVWGYVDPVTGKMTNQELHINLSQVTNFTLPNGGSLSGLEADRIVAHEMTHAIMGRNMDFASLPTWFKEGTAEFIAGADGRLNSTKSSLGTAGVVALLSSPWGGSSDEYASSYAAIKFLHQQSLVVGQNGIRDVVAQLKAGGSLDTAIASATNNTYTTAAQFITAYQSAGGGQAFINSLNLTDPDVGAIEGGTGAGVIPDTNLDTWDPLRHFKELWPSTPTLPISIQVGDQAGQTMLMPQVLASSVNLGLTGIDMVKNAAAALTQFDAALNQVTTYRSQLGTVQNRLEHTYNASSIMAQELTASESRIRDLDFGQEMTQISRHQLLNDSGISMLAQANNMYRSNVQQLLAR
jgi:flagellin